MARQPVVNPQHPEREWTWRKLESAQASEHPARDGQEVITVLVAGEPIPRHVRIAPRWRYNWVAVHLKRTNTRHDPADPRAYLTLHIDESFACRARSGLGDRVLQVVKIDRGET